MVGVDAAEVRRHLDDRGIGVWVSEAAQARIDMGARHLTSVVRASVHYLNTDEEIDRTLGLVERLAADTTNATPAPTRAGGTT